MAARFIADALGQPLATKVGQAGGWDPATGAVDRPRGVSHEHVRMCLLSSGAMDGVVLVLNQNYEPLNVCNLPRAFRLVFGEKAEVIEYDHQVIRTPRTEYRAPSVIRLQHLIRRPRPRVKLSRREVFARDRHTCQYCGRQTHDLTLDHVVPAPSRRRPHLGEPRRRRARRATTARAARRSRRRGFGSLRPPFEPRSDIYSLFTPYLGDERNEAWRTYLFLGRN